MMALVVALRAGEARVKLDRELADRLERPLTVSVDGRDFTLTPQQARLRADVEGMVQEALSYSRQGNIITRTYDQLADGEEDEDVALRLTYSDRAVTALVRRIARDVDEAPSDARIAYSATGIQKVESRNGVRLRRDELTRRIRSALEQPGSDAVVAHTEVARPRVSTADLAERHPYVITVSRAENRLRFYRGLELRKTYVISVGTVGFDTPTGLYHVQNKQVDPAWSVPNREWAGDLAGTVVPGGTPQNPLKARWMGIYDGAGIHGTSDTANLGRAASHGCIRMAVPDVIELYDQVPVQTPVYIG
jgi:lipoprotein-anchoring transpeptidase ErfK/SrfK